MFATYRWITNLTDFSNNWYKMEKLIILFNSLCLFLRLSQNNCSAEIQLFLTLRLGKTTTFQKNPWKNNCEQHSFSRLEFLNLCTFDMLTG